LPARRVPKASKVPSRGMPNVSSRGASETGFSDDEEG
jgi:hypothetical protein